MTHGQELTNEQQNIIRVIFAGLLALVIAFAAMLTRCPEPAVAMTMMIPGIPLTIANIVAWRIKMHW